VWWGYGIAVAGTAALLVARLWLWPQRGDHPAIILFMLPIMLSAYVGGLGPGLVATLCGALGATYFLLPPLHSFSIQGRLHSVQWLGLVVSGSAVSVLCEGFHRKIAEGRETQEKLRASEERFGAVLGSAMDGIISVDEQQRITFFNPAAEKMFRCTGSEAIGQRLDRFIPERFRSAHAEHIRAYGQTHITRRTMHQLGAVWGLRSDGEEFPIEASISQSDVAGQHLYTVILRDITERQRAEEALRQSETRYRTLVENIPQRIFTKSKDYRWVSINENFARNLGLRPEDVVGKADYDLFPKELADKYRADDVRIMETGVTDEFDEEYIEGNERRIVHTIKTPVRDESGAVIGLLGVFWDVTERKRAEEALRESEERARIVAESVTDVIYEWDLKDQIEWHGDVDSLMGYPPGGFPRTFDGWVATLHPEDKERVRLAVEGQLKGAAPYNVDYRVAGKDGAWRWWSARGTVLRDGQGQPRRWVGAVTDITERKRAEAARRQANEYNRSLIEACLDPLVTIAPDGRITDVNEATIKVTGLPREKLVGTDFSNYFTDPEKAREGYQQVFAKGNVTDYPLTIRHVDGRMTDVLYNATVYKDVLDNVLGVFAAARDVTAQKQASQYARSLIEASLDPLVTISPEGKITDVNEATIKVTGLPREKLVGTDFSNYFTDPGKAREGYQQVFAQGYVTDYPLTIRHVNGRLTDVLYNASVYKDTRDNVLGVFAAARDITERQRAEEEIRKLNEELEARVAQRTAQLEASNKELEAFTYSVSHDLRAPLRHIDGFSKLLVEEHYAELSPDAQEDVATIRDSILQMGRLIDDLLNLARMGRKQLNMQVTGLNSLVEEVRADLKRSNPDRLIEWKVDTLPFVECDSGLMKQVFANLLGNAAKFTRPRKSAVIEVGVTCQDGTRAVFVRDNGVGFSMKYANKLFGVFQRLHRAEDFEGTGVGLATVERIIHKHGGRVWAEAELDKGATFYFTLGSSDRPQSDKPIDSGGNS